ncbi:hypothetical protein [Evansella clarkii]|uniref:hypothetical protein n=1 Tax=Evansella clarkii TaxID=79879 RepID=UPI0009965EBA|nr:hypothetical protein [Evansella clarkii]
MGFSNKKEPSIHIDENPTQIADVKTVVEREGALSQRGTDIDVTDFLYRSGTSIEVSDLGDIDDISSLIDKEIERVSLNEIHKVSKVTETEKEDVDDE